jgi:hypothetical protein
MDSMAPRRIDVFLSQPAKRLAQRGFSPNLIELAYGQWRDGARNGRVGMLKILGHRPFVILPM